MSGYLAKEQEYVQNVYVEKSNYDNNKLLTL